MSENICPICGLPKELCTCTVIEREARKIKIYLTKRRFNKPMTIIEGIDEKSGKPLSKELKRKLACGGTYKEGRIELQGDHRPKLKNILAKMGFDPEQIEIT